jgi:GNAT superfamily N-acetyltransferase
MISIEQATARDADAICRIDATVLGDIGRNGQLRQWIAAGRCYAARQDGEVVGYAVMDQSFFRQSFVELIVVHPRHQRKGIGEALLLHLEEVCPTEKLFVSTNLSNKQMQRLCRRLEYMPSGMIDNLDPGDPEVIYCKKPQRS